MGTPAWVQNCHLASRSLDCSRRRRSRLPGLVLVRSSCLPARWDRACCSPAEMQMKANGGHIEALLAALEQPQGGASEILGRAGAAAMTDVTGFGLAGHLFAMLRESHVGAVLRLDDIPIFDGALELAVSGTRSHLHAANQVGVPIVAGADDARTDLLFDPQTAGGFLAAVPADSAEETVAELNRAGFASSLIGSIVEGEPSISIV